MTKIKMQQVRPSIPVCSLERLVVAVLDNHETDLS